MAGKGVWRVFIDTSVWIAGVVSEKGADRGGMDYLVTWDKKDFLKAAVQRHVSCRLCDPGEFLVFFRGHYLS